LDRSIVNHRYADAGHVQLCHALGQVRVNRRFTLHENRRDELLDPLYPPLDIGARKCGRGETDGSALQRDQYNNGAMVRGHDASSFAAALDGACDRS
jgi:hypothetical protein